MSAHDSFTEIELSTPEPGVGMIRLARPSALNALTANTERQVGAAAVSFDADPSIGAIVITGGERAFAAGADIGEMQPQSYEAVEAHDLFAAWDRLASLRTPLIAAVSGYALGGGCELAMLCDVVIASETARFGQPEVKLGILPGFGGTQRLTRAVGKAKAMDLCLTGRQMDAHEAERAGLVSRIVPASDVLTVACEVAATVAAMSKPAARAVKDAVNHAFESTLAAGMRYERSLFRGRFATADRKEGMAAFLEKRPAHFSDS